MSDSPYVELSNLYRRLAAAEKERESLTTLLNQETEWRNIAEKRVEELIAERDEARVLLEQIGTFARVNDATRFRPRIADTPEGSGT